MAFTNPRRLPIKVGWNLRGEPPRVAWPVRSGIKVQKRIESTEKPKKAARGRVVLAFWTAEASNWSQMLVCRHFYPLSSPDIRVTIGAVPRPAGSRLRTE